MASKPSAFASAMSSVQTCRKLLIIFSAVTVALPYLLNMTRFWMILPAVILALPAAFLWRYRATRIILRILSCLVAAAPPVYLIVLAVMGRFHVLYFFFLFVPAIALPAFALAAKSERRFDIVLLRLAAVLNAVEAGLIIAYIFAYGSWFQTVLFAATALCVLVLTLLSFPPDLSRLRHKLGLSAKKENSRPRKTRAKEKSRS